MQQHFKEEENESVLEALSQIAKKLSSRNEDRGIDPILQLYNTLKQARLQIFEWRRINNMKTFIFNVLSKIPTRTSIAMFLPTAMKIYSST